MSEKRTTGETSPRQRRTPRVNQRAVKKQETRQRILKAAAAIASREGLHAASIPRVMREAGLTIGGFYGHFASKGAMDAEIIRTVFEPYSSGALASFRRHEGLDWLERAVVAYLSPINRDHPQGCPYPSILSAVAIGPPDVKAAFTDAMRLRVGAYEAHAEAAGSDASRARAGRDGSHDRRSASRSGVPWRRAERRDSRCLQEVGVAGTGRTRSTAAPVRIFELRP